MLLLLIQVEDDLYFLQDPLLRQKWRRRAEYLWQVNNYFTKGSGYAAPVVVVVHLKTLLVSPSMFRGFCSLASPVFLLWYEFK